MKRFIKTTSALLLLGSLLLTACNKEIDPIETPHQSLAGTYKVSAMQLQVGPEARDLFATLDDCQKHSLQILSANNAYQLLNSCDATENESGSWSVNGQRITINGVAGDIVSFNGRDLVIAFNQFMGMPGRLIETLTRQ